MDACAKDLYLRLLEHIAGKVKYCGVCRASFFEEKWSRQCPRATPKMQLAKLVAGTVILGILPYDSKSVSNKDLTDRESSNIGKFYFDILYNLNSYKYDRL